MTAGKWRRARRGYNCAACVVTSAARAQPTLPPSCNAKLAKAAVGRDTMSYRVRGASAKWCEGVLVKHEVGNIELKLQAFTGVTAAIASSALRRLDTLVVEWNAPPGMKVHILARQSTNPLADYYQMDVEVPTPANGAGSWNWPVEVIKRAGMWPVAVADARAGNLPPAISVQAVGRMPNGGSDSVYLPVRIGPKGSARGGTAEASQAPVERLQITMMAKERVTVRRPSLFRIGADSSTTPVVMARGCPAVTGGAVGGDPVTIPICMPADAPAGMYVVALGALNDGAMLAATGIRFYYRAPAP